METVLFEDIEAGEVFQGRHTGNTLVKANDGVSAYVIALGPGNGRGTLGKRVEMRDSTRVKLSR